jgi:hypothetical protein
MYVRRPGKIHSLKRIHSIYNHILHHHWFHVHSCCREQHTHSITIQVLDVCVYLFPRVSSTGVMVTDGVSFLVRIDFSDSYNDEIHPVAWYD